MADESWGVWGGGQSTVGPVHLGQGVLPIWCYRHAPGIDRVFITTSKDSQTEPDTAAAGVDAGDVSTAL